MKYRGLLKSLIKKKPAAENPKAPFGRVMSKK